jgi:hypothetical protein
MDFYHESNVVLSVSLTKNKQWHVTWKDSKQPLASFDNPQAACAWAIAQAKPKGGRVLVEEMVASSPASLPDGMNAPNIFKSSIPVTWTDSGYSQFKFVGGKGEHGA